MWLADLLASELKGDLETQNGSNHVQTHPHRVNFYTYMQAIVQENWSFRVDVIFFTVPISQHNIYNGVKSVHFF
jgi:hypothetical protein